MKIKFLRTVVGEHNTTDDLFRVKFKKRELRAYGAVAHVAARQIDDPKTSTFNAYCMEDVVQSLGSIEFGLFRARMIITDGALTTAAEKLAAFKEDGIQNELAHNPQADPVKLARLAPVAGAMAVKIEQFFEEREEATLDYSVET